MRNNRAFRPCLSVFLTILVAQYASAISKAATSKIEGRVRLPPAIAGAAVTTNVLDTVVNLRTEHGQLIKTFCRRDGSFSFTDVPAGHHLLHVFNLGFVFPEVRL